MMNKHIEYQTILKNGKPEYIIVPYEQFKQIFPKYLRDKTIPHEVVNLMVDKDISQIRAWREYLGLTQATVAERMSITQAALSQMEAGGAKLRKTTLEKLAKAFGIAVEQLR